MPIAAHPGNYTAQPSEVVILLMALALTPLMLRAIRDVDLAGKTWFIVGYAMMFGSFVSTFAEGYVLGPVFNFAEHAFLAASGIAFAVGAWQLLKEMRARRAA